MAIQAVNTWQGANFHLKVRSLRLTFEIPLPTQLDLHHLEPHDLLLRVDLVLQQVIGALLLLLLMLLSDVPGPENTLVIHVLVHLHARDLLLRWPRYLAVRSLVLCQARLLLHLPQELSTVPVNGISIPIIV